MKRYTPVTIICLDTGACGMYQIPASGGVGVHLRNMVRPQIASPVLISVSIQQNSTRGQQDLTTPPPLLFF